MDGQASTSPKWKKKAGMMAAMAYMRRLHGDPATAPVADLAEQADADYDAADLALGPEGEQTTDKGHEKTPLRKKH